MLLRGRREYFHVGLASASMPQISPQKHPCHPALAYREPHYLSNSNFGVR